MAGTWVCSILVMFDLWIDQKRKVLIALLILKAIGRRFEVRICVLPKIRFRQADGFC